MCKGIEFKVFAKNALFTEPITKLGGEKCSYQIPTYEAIKGITKSIYWKPTFIWIIDKIRIMKVIEMETKGVRTIKYHNGKTDLSYYTYLRNVEYQVKAHFEWNFYNDEYAKDRNTGKHISIAKRSLEAGGRQDIFLGTRECQGYVEPCDFGTGTSDYDGKDLYFGMMFHSFSYPNERLENEDENDTLTVNLWNAKMKNGIIDFEEAKKELIQRNLKPLPSCDYKIGYNLLSIDKEYENIFGKEEEVL